MSENTQPPENSPLPRRRLRLGPGVRDARGGPPVEPDRDLRNADWPKRTWDLPPPGSPELEGLRRMGPIRPAFPELADGEDAPR